MNDSKFLSLNGLEYYDGKLKGYMKELYGSDMTVEWEPLENGKNPFKLKIALKNGNGSEIFEKTVDFPLEQTIVSGSYDASSKSLILYFQDGTSTSVPVEELIEGLASKLDLESKANVGEAVKEASRCYVKLLPDGIAPYIKINTLGGYTHTDGGNLRFTKVTSIKSMGKNLINQARITEQEGVSLGADGYYGGHARALAQGINKARALPNGKYKTNTQYTVGYKCYAEETSNGTQFAVEYADGFIEYFGTVNNLAPGRVVFTTRANRTVYSIWATYGADNTCYIKDLYIYEGVSDAAYTPYSEFRIEIPEAVRGLDGYGQSAPDNAEEYNYLDFDRGKFVTVGHTVNGVWEHYDAKKEADVSYLLGENRLLRVEEGGSVTLENEHGQEAPFEITLFTGGNESVGAKSFVGDLTGIAHMAEYYLDSGKRSALTVADAINSLLNAGNPIKITGESIGHLSGQQELKGIPVGIVANPPVLKDDIIIDKYIDGDESYLCFWVVSDVRGGESDATMDLYGAGNIYVGGGSASVADRAIADGEGAVIAERYAKRAELEELQDTLRAELQRQDNLISAKGSTQMDAVGYARMATVAIEAAKDGAIEKSLSELDGRIREISEGYTADAERVEQLDAAIFRLENGGAEVHTARYAPGNTAYTLENAIRHISLSGGKLSLYRFNAPSTDINLLSNDFISAIASALLSNTAFISSLVDAVIRELGFDV